MNSSRPLASIVVAVSVLGAAGVACTSGVEPAAPEIVFSPANVDLSADRDTTITIRNVGPRALGPIELVALAVFDGAGNAVSGPRLMATPTEIATLNPGVTRAIDLTVDAAPDIPDGVYHVALEARLLSQTEAILDLAFAVEEGALAARVAGITITAPTPSVRQGDVTAYRAVAVDSSGATISDVRLSWTVIPETAGYIDGDGRLAPYEAGAVRVAARAGAAADTVELTVTARGLEGSFEVVGHGDITSRFTSDLWVWGPVAYTGTWGTRTEGTTTEQGNTLYAWDVRDATTPVLTDSIHVDARVVNDVKIAADGSSAVITHEGSEDALNGVTLLDLDDPFHPTVRTRFTSSLQTGVHNAWIDGQYLYLVVDGIATTSGLRILDISVPDAPTVVASYYAGSSFLHDAYLRDGLAFLSHWDAGLVILDVGNGVAGGSPVNPVEVGRIETAGGDTHNAWYWPEAGYVFVGEEDFGTPGIMHVVDVDDLSRPREVATFRVAGATPHNFWLDETEGVLYLSWYGNGLRALDVTGELLGELDRQGREIASLRYAGDEGGCATTCNWAPQVHDGRIFLSDLNSGLWVTRPPQ